MLGHYTTGLCRCEPDAIQNPRARGSRSSRLPFQERDRSANVRRTKILVTVGPASWSVASLRRMADAGANGFRINFSHGSDAEHRTTLGRIHDLRASDPEPRAIVADLQGPKIRIGALQQPQYRLLDGATFYLDSEAAPGDDERAPVEVPHLTESVRPGDPVLLGDGSVQLAVERVEADRVRTRIVHGGLLTQHAGLFLPRAHLRTQILGTKDRADLALAVHEGVDFVALSFVRDAGDIHGARRALRRLPGGQNVGIIAKIERAEALRSIEGILAASDGIMVARGDLGIEVPLERLAIEQKELIVRANAAGRFSIVATQMLLSMVAAPRPTRAEATDVANAVLDGADAVMLSEESAIGQYPIDSVAWLDRIATATEGAQRQGRVRAFVPHPPTATLEASVAAAAVRLAADAGAAAIVTPTHSGRTAQLVAAHRFPTPIVALSSRPASGRRLALVWGVTTRSLPRRLSLPALRERASRIAREVLRLERGSRIVLTAGYPVEGRPTNLVTVVDVSPSRRRGRTRRAVRAARRSSAG
jgi:pyruvate kinase